MPSYKHYSKLQVEHNQALKKIESLIKENNALKSSVDKEICRVYEEKLKIVTDESNKWKVLAFKALEELKKRK